MQNERRHERVIMLVEDYKETRIAVRLMLEMSGYAVVEALNGQEAVELARENRPDLILMDLRLPVLDGVEATRQLREDETLREVPIVAFSAYGSTEKQEEALAAGCNAFIAKPFGIDEINDLVKSFLPGS
jgi:two-component system cell cycle response regulator DivK